MSRSHGWESRTRRWREHEWLPDLGTLNPQTTVESRRTLTFIVSSASRE